MHYFQVYRQNRLKKSELIRAKDCKISEKFANSRLHPMQAHLIKMKLDLAVTVDFKDTDSPGCRIAAVVGCCMTTLPRS